MTNGVKLNLATSAAFHGVWEALTQYIDNRDDSDDTNESEVNSDPATVAKLAAVQKLIDQLDAIQAGLAA